MPNVPGLKEGGVEKEMASVCGLKERGVEKEMANVPGLKKRGVEKEMASVRGLKERGVEKELVSIPPSEIMDNLYSDSPTPVMCQGQPWGYCWEMGVGVECVWTSTSAARPDLEIVTTQLN